MELPNYVELGDLVHQASKVEQKLKRKSAMRRSSSTSNPNVTTQRTQNKFDEALKKARSSETNYFKCLGRGHIASQCPTKKTMLLKEDGEIISESSSESSPSSDEEERVRSRFVHD